VNNKEDGVSTTTTHSSTGIIIGALVASIVVVVVARLRSDATLGSRLGPPDWDFSASWASSITAIGAILGTILGASVLPGDPRFLTGDAYTGLSLGFGILVVLAPFIFVATRTKSGDADDGSPIYEGYVWAFLVASAVTLWAVFGELTTLAFVFAELQHADTLSWWSVAPILATLVLSELLVAWYSVRSIGWMLDAAKNHAVRHATAVQAAASVVDGSSVKIPHAPRWSVL
jgi:hypothetical protein